MAPCVQELLTTPELEQERPMPMEVVVTETQADSRPRTIDEGAVRTAPQRVLDLVVKWLIVAWMISYSGLALGSVIALFLGQGGAMCSWLAVPVCADISGVFGSSVYAMLGGVLGAGVLGMVSFHQYASVRGAFDIRHGWGFLFAPLLACILGLIVFALMQSGLLVFSGRSDDAPTSVANFGYLSVGFLSGFGWYPATQRINQIVARFFNVDGVAKADTGAKADLAGAATPANESPAPEKTDPDDGAVERPGG